MRLRSTKPGSTVVPDPFGNTIILTRVRFLARKKLIVSNFDFLLFRDKVFSFLLISLGATGFENFPNEGPHLYRSTNMQVVEERRRSQANSKKQFPVLRHCFCRRTTADACMRTHTHTHPSVSLEVHYENKRPRVPKCKLHQSFTLKEAERHDG